MGLVGSKRSSMYVMIRSSLDFLDRGRMCVHHIKLHYITLHYLRCIPKYFSLIQKETRKKREWRRPLSFDPLQLCLRSCLFWL